MKERLALNRNDKGNVKRNRNVANEDVPYFHSSVNSQAIISVLTEKGKVHFVLYMDNVKDVNYVDEVWFNLIMIYNYREKIGKIHGERKKSA